MKIGIIGAGISGLSIGQLLKDKFEIQILEKNDFIGGIARPKEINGIPYHTVGGHCMNSKNPEVMKFIFNILPEDEWHIVERNAKINFKGHLIDYPIEFAIKEIAGFDENLAFKIVKDFFQCKENNEGTLEEWFRGKFGDTLSEEYFIPYNKKLWARNISEMSSEWVKDKLPSPDKKEIFKALIYNCKDNMPHSKFYYPNTNTMNTFIDALAKGLDIKLGYNVKKIEQKNTKWIINGEKQYDILINTMPLKELPLRMSEPPREIINAANKLKYNKITSVFWETYPVNNGWTYHPESKTITHRHVHIGNFIFPRQNTFTIIEAIGDLDKNEMIKEAKNFPYLKKAIDYNNSDYAYVVYDENYKENVKLIKEYLSKKGIHTLGRFGEWVYYNMDKCIESAMRLSEKLQTD